MKENKSIVVSRIEPFVIRLRGKNVLIDADLAILYGVTTKALNQAVRRNQRRFPGDFVFELTHEEKNELVTNCDRFRNLKHSVVLPNAFTEHGAIMAANVLRSQQAIDASIFVVRAFIEIREQISAHQELRHHLRELDRKVARHDKSIRSIIEAIRQLTEREVRPKRRIGFGSEN